MQSYISLARKYRPQKFEEMFGQDVPRRILQNAISTKIIHHAYIFSGVRGTGKTTAARIFAKALNCVNGPVPEPCNSCENCVSISKGNFIDVIEMDAGSQTSVDDIRAIKESALYPPLKGRYKVFIIDEAHMLSQSAFNALLKVFEEPPEFDIFILATTEPHKIPETVQSRAIRIDFQKIPKSVIVQRLRYICEQEGIECDDSALHIIAEEGQGSLRDAISLLESVIMFTERKKVSEEVVRSILGIAPQLVINNLIKYTILGDTKKVDEVLNGIIEKGYNVKRVCKAYAEAIKDICLHLDFSAPISEDLEQIVKETGITLEHAIKIANAVLRFENDLKFSLSEEVALKMFFFKICYLKKIKPVEEIIKLIKSGENIAAEVKNPFELILEYLELSGKVILLEKIRNSGYEFKDNTLVIRTDDPKVQKFLQESKKELEGYIKEKAKKSIVVRVEKIEEKPDVGKIFGDEIEEGKDIKIDDILSL